MTSLPDNTPAHRAVGRFILLWSARTLLTATLIVVVALLVGMRSSRGDDFIQDYLSARAWLSGNDPYQDLAVQREQHGLPPTRLPVDRNPHPPLAVVLAAPVCWLPLPTALRVNQAIQVLILAFVWNWAFGRFGRAGWATAAAGGLLGIWSPVWQGLDLGQPVGVAAGFTCLLWHLARKHSNAASCGSALGLACTFRPFYAVVAAVGVRWNTLRLCMAFGACAATAGAIFLLVGLSPIAWVRASAAVGETFIPHCGSLPSVLGLGPFAGAMFFIASIALVAIVRWRGADVDCTVALGMAVAMLTYPLAWYHYDAALIPVAIWIATRPDGGRVALLGVAMYAALRAIPNVDGYVRQQVYLQVLGRSILLALLVYRLRRVTRGEARVRET